MKTPVLILIFVLVASAAAAAFALKGKLSPGRVPEQARHSGETQGLGIAPPETEKS